MPIIKSAKKRVSVANKAAARNRRVRRSLRDAVKAFQSTLSGDKKKATTAHSQAQSAIDKALKKNIIHKNKAARKKSRLAKAAKAAGAPKPVAKAKKPVAKAPAKAATKKPAKKK